MRLRNPQITDYLKLELLKAVIKHKSEGFNTIFCEAWNILNDQGHFVTSEETYRLRSYELLQGFVAMGGVSKNGKTYAANEMTQSFADELSASLPPLPPRPKPKAPAADSVEQLLQDAKLALEANGVFHTPLEMLAHGGQWNEYQEDAIRRTQDVLTRMAHINKPTS